MIVVALVLTSLGIADVVRAHIRGRSGILVAGAAGLAVVVAYSTVMSIEWWWVAVTSLLVVGWVVPTSGESAPPLLVWVITAPLAVVVAALVLPTAHQAESSALAQWYQGLPYPALQHLGFDAFALAIGCTLFLIETSNVMVRLVLNAATRDDRVTDSEPSEGHASGRRWRVLLPFRSSVDVVAEELPASHASTLRGGRIIGPLERVFIFALALAGEFTAIGAVVAAKGIVRFPEISKNGSGSKAEEFLIGSFSSWALVVVAVVLLTLATT